MITLEDIEDFSALTREQIRAIADHENLPELDAALLGDYLMHIHHGPQKVHAMLCDDIRAALHADDAGRARALYAVLHAFIERHPNAARGANGEG